MNSYFHKKIEKNSQQVNRYIISLLYGKPDDLYEAASSYIHSGGKRLRPLMVIKSCEMFNGSRLKALPAAAAVELIHNFSLVHDDIMDNDEIRHNIETVHRKYGLPLAILAGDTLFSMAFHVISYQGMKNKIPYENIVQMISKLSYACVQVCEGQALDVSFSKNKEFPTEIEYIDMINKKTAALFQASCALGALSSGAKNKDVKNMDNFGKNIGIAFQLIDDLIGIIGDPKFTGKAVGNDLREGKKTYPILLALNTANESDRQTILDVFGKRTSSEKIKNAVKIISALQIEDKVRKKAISHMKMAEKAIQNYPDLGPKKTLVEIANFIVKRSR